MKTENEKIEKTKIPFHFDGRKIVFEKGMGFGNFNCSRCKSENGQRDIEEFTGEGMIHCRDCGYYRYFEFKRDKEGKFIRKDKKRDYGFHNLKNNEILHPNPNAAFSIERTDKDTEHGTIVSKNGLMTFLKEIDDRIIKERDITKITISQLVDGGIIKEIIFPKAA